jgi:hypothetical protein
MLEENAISLKRQAVRIVVSDFLFPHDPQTLVRRLARDASTLWIIQLLNAWEAQPTQLGGRRLIAVESFGEVDLFLDPKPDIWSVGPAARGLSRCCHANATFVSLVADRGLAALCREDLSVAGVLRPA